MSVKCFLRLASGFTRTVDSSLLAALPVSNSVLRHSSTVSPVFAEYHRKRAKEWKRGQTRKDSDEKADEQQQQEQPKSTGSTDQGRLDPTNLLYTIPELVPTTYWGHRDSVRETLERADLAKRRAAFKIPEFYVGSILSVTVADNMSPTKQTKFVGLCIQKGEPGLRHRFVLRNVIDDQGIEIMYELYNPMIRDITVLKLQKRLDDDLAYLRDALPEYSTIPFDMKPIPRAAHEAVPINEVKVKMKPRPWTAKWERYDLQGVDESTIGPQLYEKLKLARLEPTRNSMWQKFDLATQYRTSITREETDDIYQDMVGRFDRSKDMDSLPEEERPIISRKKARKV